MKDSEVDDFRRFRKVRKVVRQMTIGTMETSCVAMHGRAKVGENGF